MCADIVQLDDSFDFETVEREIMRCERSSEEQSEQSEDWVYDGSRFDHVRLSDLKRSIDAMSERIENIEIAILQIKHLLEN